MKKVVLLVLVVLCSCVSKKDYWRETQNHYLIQDVNYIAVVNNDLYFNCDYDVVFHYKDKETLWSDYELLKSGLGDIRFNFDSFETCAVTSYIKTGYITIENDVKVLKLDLYVLKIKRSLF